MKAKLVIPSFLLCMAVMPVLSQIPVNSPVTYIKLSGYVGERIDDCIEHRVKAQDVDHLVEPFRHRKEKSRWQSEFWGKWIQGAIASYRYNKDPELYQIIKNAAEALMKTQTPDGYIGNYVGMPSSSILEPVMYLYNRTKEDRYLDYAKYIVEQWETPEGPQLISKAIAGVPVANRFPHPKTWFSRENGQKAYEMMSCYEGLLELHKVTGNPLYLSVVEKTVGHIIQEEINVAGSGSAFECWYSGRVRQTIPTYHTMETCVTFTWMQLCNRLLEMTGNSLYADYMESAIYNALMASLKADASQIAKYSPLEGCRHEGEEQCGMHINCCNANGPRAFAMIPQFAYQVKDDCIRVNFYGQSEADITLPGKKTVRLKQVTDYPVIDEITLEVGPAKESLFTIALRIPAWSSLATVQVNGESVEGILQGAYLPVTRKWKAGDRITVRLDLRARLVEMNQAQAIVRGPLVLARDSRFNDGFIDETAVVVSKDGYVELTPVEAPEFAWMTFTAPLILGTDLEGNSAARPVHFCDFASAGNTWDKSQRYRVWLPRTLNVMHVPYKPY